jgi:WD40 repeat protein
VAVTPDGDRIVSGAEDGTVRVWDLDGGELLATFTGHEHIVRAVAVTPDGDRIVSGSNDGTVRVWELPTE